MTYVILTILSLSPLTATVKSTGLENAAIQGKYVGNIKLAKLSKTDKNVNNYYILHAINELVSWLLYLFLANEKINKIVTVIISKGEVIKAGNLGKSKLE